MTTSWHKVKISTYYKLTRMDINQLQQGIVAKFALGTSKETRLLFWYDTEQSFREVLSSLALPEVTVLGLSRWTINERLR